MIQSCPRQGVLVPRIERALKVSLGTVNCHIVDRAGMEAAMRRVGWGRNETVGVVGFQVGSNVYVRDDAHWTTLHELVHKAGVNADRMNRWVAEGLTEAIARALKTNDEEHQPTYPTETRWVNEVLLPKLGLTAVQLGRILARAPSPPRTLADLLVKADPALDRARLVEELRAQRPDPPRLDTSRPVARGRDRVGGEGSRMSVPRFSAIPHSTDDSTTASLAMVLVVSGAALGLPLFFGQPTSR